MQAVQDTIDKMLDYTSPLTGMSDDMGVLQDFFTAIGADIKKFSKEKWEDIKKAAKKLQEAAKDSENPDPDKYVSSLTGFIIFLKEAKVFWDTLKPALESMYADGSDAKKNAVLLASRYLTESFFTRRYPEIKVIADAIGIGITEWDEIRRLFQFLFPWWIDQPETETRIDSAAATSRSIFLLGYIFLLFGRDKLNKLIERDAKLHFNYGWEPGNDEFPNAARLAGRILSFRYYDEVKGQDAIVSFLTIPEKNSTDAEEIEQSGYRYGMEIFGEIEIEKTEGRLTQIFKTGGSGAFMFGEDETVSRGTGSPILTYRFEDEAPEPDKDETGTRFENGKLIVEAGAENNDLFLQVSIKDTSLVISSKGRDGFLKKVLPSKDARIDINFVTGWSVKRGFFMEGPAGQQLAGMRFPVSRQLPLGIHIPDLFFGLTTLADEEGNASGAKVELSAQVQLNWKPFLITIDRLGLYAGIQKAGNNNGNLGELDIDAGLKPPSGVGFVIKSDVVTGGGFLYIDAEKGEYIGAGELCIKNRFSVKAVCIILTRSPDGKEGFSFLLLISAEYAQGVELGAGFKVTGVGGLIGINRSISEDAVRVSVRENNLDRIMFPENPVGNAPAIVKALGTIFPVKDNRYAFGFMMRMQWGPPDLVDLKAGLFMEAPEPYTFMLIGVIKIHKDVKGKELLKLQVNFAAILDFESRFFTFDAALFESRVGTYKLVGDVVFRYTWAGTPAWIFSAGGFHPAFTPPSNLKLPAKMERMAVRLKDEEKISLILSCYVALTSNTFQIGGKIDLKAKWSKFTITAGVGVDALFQYYPFRFMASLKAEAEVSWGSRRLARIAVSGIIEGPGYWRAAASLTFSIWIWDYTFDKTWEWGDDEDRTSIPATEVMPQLLNVLKENRNWRLEIPDKNMQPVILRSTIKDAQPDVATEKELLLAHPFSRLSIMQELVPLKTKLSLFAAQRPADFSEFSITLFSENDRQLSTSDLPDFFVPALFIQMDDGDKLNRKSYEEFPAGISLTDSLFSTGKEQLVETDYDEKIYDTLPVSKPRGRAQLPEGLFMQWSRSNSVARSRYGRIHKGREQLKERKITVGTQAYQVINPVTGEKITQGTIKNMTQAYSLAQTLFNSDTRMPVMPAVVPEITLKNE